MMRLGSEKKYLVQQREKREENEGTVLDGTGKEENIEVLDRQRTRSKKQRRGDFGEGKFHRNLQLF